VDQLLSAPESIAVFRLPLKETAVAAWLSPEKKPRSAIQKFPFNLSMYSPESSRTLLLVAAQEHLKRLSITQSQR
jgi:hypothetical protein